MLDITGKNDSNQTSRRERCISRNPITDQEYFSVSIYLVSVDLKECRNNRTRLSIIMRIGKVAKLRDNFIFDSDNLEKQQFIL